MGLRIPLSDLKGKKFGLLTIKDEAPQRGVNRFVVCDCECGTVGEFRLADVRFGRSTNCGCVRSKKMVARNTTHGLTSHPLYRMWRGMKERCEYSGHAKYFRYGGRGITVCPEWKSNFKSFVDWATVSGYAEGLEIDRINNDGNYEPDNCRWVTVKANRRNTSSNRILVFNGVSKCMAEWAEEIGISADAIKDRLNKLGWSVERALSTPLNAHLC